MGLKINGALAKTLRFTITHPTDNGPDLKILAAPKLPSSAAVLLKEAIDLINSLEEQCFKNKNRRETLIEKINVAQGMIAKGNYKGAAQKLDNDIVKKIGTCDAPSNSDWITCCPSLMDRNYMVTIANLVSEAAELLD